MILAIKNKFFVVKNTKKKKKRNTFKNTYKYFPTTILFAG